MHDINSPLVTTILTTFRRPKLLQRALASVLNQVYPAIRVLVLDDASGDETEEIASNMAKRDTRVVYIRHEHNIGMTPNWQFGLQQVETPYFSFLSDDDVHLPNFYRLAVAHLEANADTDFFCGATIAFDYLGGIGGVSTEGWEEGTYRPYQGMLKMMENAISWDGIVFRRELVQRIGTLRNIHSTDYDFQVRAARWGSFYVSHEPCAMFMHHPGRAWGHTDNEKVFHEFFPTALGMLSGDDLPADVRALAWAAVNRFGFTTGKYLVLTHIINGEPVRALEVANYLRRFTVNSLGSLRLIAIAKAAMLLPFVSKVIRMKLTRNRFPKNRLQKLYQRKYGGWISYANRLSLKDS